MLYNIDDFRIGNNIKHYRKLHCISVKKLARKLNVSIGTYHKIERGERSLRAKELPIICELLVVDYGTIYKC